MRNDGFGCILYLVIGIAILYTLSGLINLGTSCVGSCNVRIAAQQREKQAEADRAERYSQASELLRAGQYGSARSAFRQLSDYRDSEMLYNYARAKELYNTNSYSSYNCYDYLAKIPDDYAGDFVDEIDTFRKEAELHRTEKKAAYDAEMQRQEEERKRQAEEQRKRDEEGRADAAKHSAPYVGMPAYYIDYTQLGFHSIKLEKETTLNGVKYPCTEYSWQSKSGMFIYKAIVVGGRVWSVEDIAAELTGSRRKSSTSDPYNASDYAHADDFYYDHRDDFFDYEEAEDYYDKHN